MPSIELPPKEAPMKTLLSIVAVAAVITLTGCASDKHITEVKALPFSYPINEFQNPILRVPDPNLTVDQALDYRKVCDSVKWKVDQTEQHQYFVEYRCDYKGVKDSAFAERDKADIVSEGDVYQWTFGSDGHPALNYAGFVIRFKGGSIKDFKMDTVRVMEMASNNKVTNADEAFSYLTNSRIPVKPASPFTDTTYGNTLAAFYPGHNAVEAARLAYLWKRLPLAVDDHVDALGYPALNAGRQPAGWLEENADRVFPVNPADVQFVRRNVGADMPDYIPNLIKEIPLLPSKLFCTDALCYDSDGKVVGRAPASIQAQELAKGEWVRVSATGTVKEAVVASRPNSTDDSVAAAMASTAMTPPAPAPTGAPTSPTPNGLTTNTYGNAAASFYPTEKPKDALLDALGHGIPSSNLNIIDIDPNGYPVYGMECESNGQCVNDGGLNLGSEADAAAQMFPVNPSDISRLRIMCDQYLCRNSQGSVIGRNPSMH